MWSRKLTEAYGRLKSLLNSVFCVYKVRKLEKVSSSRKFKCLIFAKKTSKSAKNEVLEEELVVLPKTNPCQTHQSPVVV